MKFRTFLVLLLFTMLIAFALILFGFYERSENLKSLSGSQYSVDYHWDHMPVTYYVDADCSSLVRQRLAWAFKIIENETNISFKQASNQGDIYINCYPYTEFSGDTYTLGDAQITNVKGNVIESARIDFYLVDKYGSYYITCDKYPNVEIHEILHTFGFGHINNADSIMYYESDDCAVTSIDPGIISELKSVYEK